MRLVSICPSNTELVAYLGLTDQLVGVDHFSDWPEAVQDLPKLGPDLNIRMDKVEELKPDLVLASLSVPGMEKNIEELEKRGLPYIVLNPNSLQEISQDLRKVGEHTGTSDRAGRVIEVYNRIIQYYVQLANTIQEKPNVYWEWWPEPVFTPGGKNWLTEISELAGAKNAFADQDMASVQTDWNEVYKRNPDVVCMVWMGVKERKMDPDHVRNREGWKNVKAVKHDQIHLLEEAFYCRPSPRLLVGLQKVAALLHPNVFPQGPFEDELLQIQ